MELGFLSSFLDAKAKSQVGALNIPSKTKKGAA